MIPFNGTAAPRLTSAQAADRLKQYGINRLNPPRKRAVLLQFLAHFGNPLVLILLAASGVSALTGDATGAIIIGLIVVMSATLDFAQSYRAGRAADRLTLQVAVTAIALRDNRPCDVPVAELVPGDVVLLSAGNLIPADACWRSRERRKTFFACAPTMRTTPALRSLWTTQHKSASTRCADGSPPRRGLG